VIIAATFGFDEKFAIRALMRHPPSDRTRVVVLLPEEEHDERVERGLSVLNDFVKRYVNEEGVELVRVPVGLLGKARECYGFTQRARSDLLRALTKMKWSSLDVYHP
jgi:hypothetical protein